MAFDSVVTNPGRLKILTALAPEPAQSFVEVRRRTGLTDGNLATHARRLASVGYVAIEKSINEGKPLTTIHLTREGREALAAHARSLMSALEPASASRPDKPVERQPDLVAMVQDDDWVD